MKIEDLMFDVEQHIEVNAPLAKVFAGVLHRFGEGHIAPNGAPMPLVLEPKAGGRWYRNRGAGVEHLWGFVQVIKPPSLLELSGPMFMSYPANNHIEIKLEEIGNGVRVGLRHRAIGMISAEHRRGLSQGWRKTLDELRTLSE